MKHRKFMSLTDEEIIGIIKDIFPATKRVDNIKRFEKWERIECDIYIMEEYPDIADTLELVVPSEINPVGITTHDFNLTVEEYWKWSQWLLAKGVDDRLKDNPYMLEKEERLNSIVDTLKTLQITRRSKGCINILIKDFCEIINRLNELM